MQAKALQEAVQSLRCQLSDTAAAPVQLELQAEQTASINAQEQVPVANRRVSVQSRSQAQVRLGTRLVSVNCGHGVTVSSSQMQLIKKLEEDLAASKQEVLQMV